MQYLFGDYVLDTARQELCRAGEPVPLRRKVFQVLVYLLAHHERVVPKQELLERLWPDQFVGDEALLSCIRALRRALGERGRAPRVLRTLHGQGYRVVAHVEQREHGPADDATPDRLVRQGERSPRQAEAPSPPLFSPRTDAERLRWEAPDGEHKQVTVLCGALAEALTLATRLGPEAMHALMREVLALAQETVQRYEGTLFQVSGEGFLALFGAPVAQEDHARRAVLAALELRQRLHAPHALRGQPSGVALRLGLHTGPVVVGPLASAPPWPYTAAGATLHLATRLQQQAAPDTVLVSAATYALVQEDVQGEACAPLAPEARSIPVPVYALRALTRRRAGVPHRGAWPLSRCVGRTQELALLHARLDQAVRGQGQVIGIVGEPGIGKSRLLAEFSHSLDGQAVPYCEGHCLAYSSATPYLPVRDLLRQLWGLPDPARAAVLTALVQQRLHEAGVTSEAEALLLLQLLDIPVDMAPVAALSPPERKTRTFAVLRHLIQHASQGQPLVLAVENLHWIDPTSEAWLASLVERLGDLPVLLLMTYRTGYQAPWVDTSSGTQVALPRLSPGDSLAVLQSVPQAAQLTAALQQAIVARAAGNPFFVEELTWAAVEQGAHTDTVPLPDTIEAVLAARLDRLPPETKHLAQVAAVIGTEVSVPLLQRLAGLSEDALSLGLARLQGAELLYELRLFPEHIYTFKHVLTRDVAYGSLLQEWRRGLHAQIVDAMEALDVERRSEQVERLAHHAVRGEVWDKALVYCRQAGAKALAGCAYREAVGYLEQALEALTHLPPDRTTLEQAVDVRCALAPALQPLTQWEQLLTHLRDAEPLAEALADQRRLGIVSLLLANTLRNMQSYEPAWAYCQRAHAIVTTLGDVEIQRDVNLQIGAINYNLGDYRQALIYVQQNLTILPGERGYELFSLAHHSAAARTWMVMCLSELGAFADGVVYGNEALRMAEEGGRPYERLAAYWRVGALYVRQGTLHQAIPLLERGVSLGQEVSILNYYRSAAVHLALAYALAGRTTDALPLLEQIEGNPIIRGEAYLLAGCVEEADRLAQRGLAHARDHKMQGNEARALWLLGEIALQRDPPDVASAEAYYRQALALAEELGMRPLQAHCHRSLGTLYAQTGQQVQARAALTTAIAMYRAMDMTFWLPQTEATLAYVE
jgi:class 3 adenylate cyclase/tetratricopeptide (TPR) repeat protein